MLGDTSVGVKASTTQALCLEKLRAAYSMACATNQTGVAPVVLMEENERWSTMGKIYYSPACRELEEHAATLITIARNQQDLRRAA